MTKQYTLYIGHNINNKPVFTDDEVERGIQAYCEKIGIDGYTLVESMGFYKGVKEKTTQLVIIGDNDELIERLTKHLAWFFGQECIMLTVSNLEATFLTGKCDSELAKLIVLK